MPIIRKINDIVVNGPVNGSTGASITGSIAEAVSQSVLIPANTFKQYDIVGLYGRLRKENTNNTATIRLRINTTPTIGGQIVGFFSSTLASHLLIPVYRRIVIKTLDGTGDGTIVIDNGNPYATDIGSTIEGYVSLPIDWTVDNYLVVTGQLINASDILNCMICGVDCPEGIFQPTWV
jgi:hypothetical protein